MNATRGAIAPHPALVRARTVNQYSVFATIPPANVHDNPADVPERSEAATVCEVNTKHW